MQFRPTVFYALTAAVIAVALPARAQDSGVVFIENATLVTVTHGVIDRGSILIRDGKIAAVGDHLTAPLDAQIIDASGMYVSPGIIDCHTHIAIDGDVNEASISVSSMANIKDVLNPEDINIYRELANGVTEGNVLHGSANPIGGQTIVIKMRWGQPAANLPFEGALPGIKFALGENPKRSNFPAPPGVPRRYPATRMGVLQTIRDAFSRAVAYQKSWDDYDRLKASGRPAIPPRPDLQLEPLVEVLQGKRYVHVHCYVSDEILGLIRVADEYHFKIRTWQHVLEGYKIAPELAAYGAGASTFSDWWGYKMEAYDAIPYNAAIMTDKGIIVSINSDDPAEAAHLNQEAAKSMRYGGLTPNQAIRLVTLNPAIQLGIDKRVGSIDVGKDADLVIWNHDPLSVYAVAQKTLIDGRAYFDRQEAAAQQAARQKEKQELLRKEKQQGQPAARPGGRPHPHETAAAVAPETR